MKLRVPPEVYESYHDIANKHMRQELSVKQFRGHLESLFKNYPEILEILYTRHKKGNESDTDPYYVNFKY